MKKREMLPGDDLWPPLPEFTVASGSFWIAVLIALVAGTAALGAIVVASGCCLAR